MKPRTVTRTYRRPRSRLRVDVVALVAAATSEAMPTAPADTEQRGAAWEGIATFLDQTTDEPSPRLIHSAGLSFRELPMPLMAMFEDDHGSLGDTVSIKVGRIESWEVDGANLVMHGTFDRTPDGDRAEQWAADGTARVSVDTNPLAWQITAPPEVVAEQEAEIQAWLDGEAPDVADMPVTDDGRVIVDSGEQSEYIFEMLETEVMGLTMVPFSAFAESKIGLTEVAALVAAGGIRLSFPMTIGTDGAALTASGSGLAPVDPPVAWFHDPELVDVTPLTVTPEGRVYGHVTGGTCHISYPGECVECPLDVNYAYFANGRVVTAEGEEVWTGRLVLGTDHADTRGITPGQASDHYAHTGRCVADVVMGENGDGYPWIAGAIRPDATPEDVRALRASDVSPDWREINGQMTVVGLIAVNISGLPVPRPQAVVAGGRLVVMTGSNPMHPVVADVDARLAVLAATAAGGLGGVAALAAGGG